MADGCPERGDFAFLRWIWNWKNTHRPRFLENLKGKPQVLTFRSSADLKSWLENLP